jgi:hypothetical protein
MAEIERAESNVVFRFAPPGVGSWRKGKKVRKHFASRAVIGVIHQIATSLVQTLHLILGELLLGRRAGGKNNKEDQKDKPVHHSDRF